MKLARGLAGRSVHQASGGTRASLWACTSRLPAQEPPRSRGSRSNRPSEHPSLASSASPIDRCPTHPSVPALGSRHIGANWNHPPRQDWLRAPHQAQGVTPGRPDGGKFKHPMGLQVLFHPDNRPLSACPGRVAVPRPRGCWQLLLGFDPRCRCRSEHPAGFIWVTVADRGAWGAAAHGAAVTCD